MRKNCGGQARSSPSGKKSKSVYRLKGLVGLVVVLRQRRIVVVFVMDNSGCCYHCGAAANVNRGAAVFAYRRLTFSPTRLLQQVFKSARRGAAIARGGPSASAVCLGRRVVPWLEQGRPHSPPGSGILRGQCYQFLKIFHRTNWA